MKRLIIILCLLISITGISQSVITRATPGNTVSDARWQALYNAYLPRYIDTSAANVPFSPPPGGVNTGPLGIDSCGAIIFTYDVNNFWARACNPKRWVRVSADQILPDGVYAGGDVGYTGNGLDFFETAATYVLNGVIHNSPTVSPITLDPSDPTFARIDLIGLGPTGPTKITGTPSANPQEPSYNPQTFIRRAAVTVNAGAITPQIATSIVYDEDLGLPDEWTPGGTGTTNFAATDFPYHLTIYANTTSLSDGQYKSFTFNDTVNSATKNSIVGFIRLASVMPLNQNLFMQLYYQGNPVSLQLPFTGYGVFRSIINQYQPVVFPMPSFGSANVVFDEIRVIAQGSGTFPVFGLDFIQFQTGFSPVVTQRDFGVQDNFAYSPRQFDFNNTNFRWLNINKYISTVSPISDSAFTIRTTSNIDIFRVDAINNTANIYTLIAGLPANPTFVVTPAFSRIPNGFPLQFDLGGFAQSFQQPLLIKRLWPIVTTNDEYKAGIVLDNDITGATNADSSIYHPLSVRFTSTVTNFSTQKLFIDGRGAINSGFIPHTATFDSIVVRKNGYYQAATLAETVSALGLGGTVTSIGFNTATGIRSTAEPLTSTGTIRIDTTVIATRAWAQSIAGGGGFTGVTSVGVTDGSGFDLTVTNPTSTPVISLTTTVANTQIPYSNSGALAGSANLTWTNATNRLGVGATSAAYLSLAPSTTSQASLNLGNAGTAPTSPQNADVWVAGNHILTRLNGVTYQLDQQSAAGVSSITGTANQIIASASTGAVTLSLPQSIATTSTPTFQRLTLSGAAATANAILTSHTDPAAAAGVLTNSGTRLAFSFATTYKRFALTNDVTPTNGQIPIGNGTDFTVSAISPNNNSMVITNGSGSITVGLNMTPQTLTDGATITWNAANGFNAVVTLGGTGRTLARSNWVAGATYTITIIQGTGGSKTIAVWPTGITWPGGTAPTLSTAAGAVDMVSFYFDGTNLRGAFNTDYR